MKRFPALFVVASLCLLLLLSCGREVDPIAPGADSGDPKQSEGSVDPAQIVFELYAMDAVGSANGVLRWKGDRNGPLPDSPESSERPTLGFGNPYELRWKVVDDDGIRIGARFRASQEDPHYLLTHPGLVAGDPVSFPFENRTPRGELPAEGCGSGPDCPHELRFESSTHYVFELFGFDLDGQTRAVEQGLLYFDANYPPESSLPIDGEYPRYRLGEGPSVVFAPGDTIPTGAYATLRIDGYDRREGSVADPDSFCCDEVVDLETPEVVHQGRLRLVGDEGNRDREFSSLYSDPIEPDTLGFLTGPFAYTVQGRTLDEHLKPDPTPAECSFVSGFRPRVLELQPATGDSLILRNPAVSQSFGNWPENEVSYTVEMTTLYWDGEQYLESDCGEGCAPVPGAIFRYRLRFEGAPDPREPHEAVRAWAYSLNSENDPENLILDDGPGESPDLSFYNDSTVENLWEFGEEEAVEIFVPNVLWLLPDLFEPGSGNELFEQTGGELRRHLGAIALRVKGRTTGSSAEFELYMRVRPGAEFLILPIESMGRRSDVGATDFKIYLGLDPANTGTIQRLWPDF